MKFDKQNEIKLKLIKDLNQSKFQGEHDKKELFRDLSAYPVNFSNGYMLRRRFGNMLEKVDSVKQTLKMTV